MILRSIGLQGWRCFANRVEVGPFDDRLNVIHGPNGSGKSTLMWALVRGLFDNHRVGGRSVSALQPWGRELTPSVSIEFDHDGQRFRLSKQFLKSPCCELSRMENDRFVRLAEGDAADQRLREILGGETPGRGVTKPEHWGLAQVLWAPQDGLALPELSSGVTSAIRTSLGTQIADPTIDSVEREIHEAYHAIYTATGNLKRGKDAPAVVDLQHRLSQAQEQQCELAEKVAAFETAGRRIEDLKSLRDQVGRDREELAGQLEAARQNARAYGELLARRDKQQETARAAEARHAELKQRIEGIRAAAAELKDAEAELARLEADAPLQVKAVRARRSEAGAAETELAAIRSRRRDVDTANQKAKLAERFVENRRRCAELDSTIEKVTEARGSLEELRQQRNRLVAPDADRLEQIRKVLARRQNTEVKLAAASITVSIVPENDLELDVVAADQPGRRTVAADQPCTIQGSPEVAFRVPGVAMFRSTGPTGSVDTLRRQLADARQELDALTEGFGTDDINRPEPLHRQAADLDAEIDKVDVRIEALLGNRPLEVIQQERARSAAARDEILAEHPDWAQSPPDPDTIAAEADQVEHAFVTDVEEAEARWKKAEQAHSLAAQAEAAHKEKLDGAKRRIATLRGRLDTLADDGRNEAGQDEARREAALRRFAMEWDAAEGNVKQAEEQLARFAGDPRKDAETLQRQLDRLQEEMSTANRNLNTDEGRLQELTAQAPYSRLSEVEEDINRLENTIAAEQLRMDAVRLLFETVGRCRSEAVETVLGPVQRRASRTLQRIAGARLGDVRFDENFLPEQVAPQGAPEPVPLEEISGGEKEQVHLAVRLALADVLFADQRQLVVLDDILTSTDTPRLARTLRILEEAADKFQILVLTCHAERYRGLPQAKFFDLEAMSIS